MKKTKMILFLFTFIFSFIAISANAHAATPTLGYRWSSSSITYYNDGTNSFYSGIWNTASICRMLYKTSILSLSQARKI